AGRNQQLWRFDAKPGPWGKIDCVRIAVEMPDAFISLDEIKNIHAHWFFKGPRNDAVQFLKSAGLTEAQLNSVLKEAKWEETLGGYWVSPSDQLVLSLSKAARHKIYSHLAAHPQNVPQYSPFIFRQQLLPEVLKNSGLTDETEEKFKALLYTYDDLFLFADTDIFVNSLPTEHEKIRFLKTISRTATLLVKLNVDEKTDVESLVNYWGYGGRSKDVRALLQSMASVPGGSKVDVAHLLPAFVRQRIYNYPNPDLVNVTNQHCHWTSMNFLNPIPDDRFSEQPFVRQVVEAEFMPVTDAPRLGDVIFFLDGQGMVIHSATYIADNIVFTKNGGGANRPWVYMEMEDLLALYLKPHEGLKTVIYRRKSV
ncbi:MAG: hypothetical protein ACK4UN_13400, partial [Limisphaerales bacterium]